jgi:hypothetical protein
MTLKTIPIIFIFLISLNMVLAECVDSDAHLGEMEQYLEKGTCTDSTSTYHDECTEDGRIREYRCSIHGSCYGNIYAPCNSLGFDGNYKCEDARCVQTDEPAEGNIILTNFDYDEIMYESNKHVTVFIDVYNEGTLNMYWGEFKSIINGVEDSVVDIIWINPKESQTQSATFKAKDGSNSIVLQVLDHQGNILDTYSTTIEIEVDSCDSDSDCNDDNPSTLDSCSGEPKSCKYEAITDCVTGDNFCPESCIYDKDKDCPECFSDPDCNDNTLSTKDTCSDSRCTNMIIKECITGDNYCPDKCNYKQDDDCIECGSDLDCDDNDSCTVDKCTEKQCLNEMIDGCQYNDECLKIGSRVESSYCSANSLQEQKPLKESCNHDYECINEYCSNNVCSELNFMQKILGWIKNIFGG